MSEQKTLLTTNRKALTINLDDRRYGTFAEIGAGQEVARVFFQAGGASGTVAKTISAYDMTFSDAIYGKAPRYVSRERLALMLDHEYALLHERLGESRGDRTTFFAFADTVATRNFKGTNEAHGWMGILFQSEPGAEPSSVVLHVRMADREAVLQQEALGIVGTNLIYGAFTYTDDSAQLIKSLLDNLSPERIEVDMLKFEGPAFGAVDNRLMSLHLVNNGLTHAVMFAPNGEVQQPSEVLYKKAILVERGSFRPVTHVNVDMLTCATAQFVQEPLVQKREVVVLLEITMNNLLAAGELDPHDFLARVDILGSLGFTVLISNYPEYYRLTSYFRRYTREMIGVAMGINNLLELFNEKYYENLPGGILEAFGRLFRNSVKLYVYPMRQEAYNRYRKTGETTAPFGLGSAAPTAFSSNVLITAKNVQVAGHLQNLYAHLLENRFIDSISGFNTEILDIFSRDALRRIQEQDASWENHGPRDRRRRDQDPRPLRLPANNRRGLRVHAGISVPPADPPANVPASRCIFTSTTPLATTTSC
jgi:hypothetical protein